MHGMCNRHKHIRSDTRNVECRSGNPIPYVSFLIFFIVYMSHVDLNDHDRAEDYNGGGGEGDNL